MLCDRHAVACGPGRTHPSTVSDTRGANESSHDTHHFPLRCPPPLTVTFKPNSTGIVATIFYEWSDFDRLGKYGPDKDVFGYSLKSYVCTPLAVRQGLCEDTDLGNFIVDGSAPSVFKQKMDFGTGNTQQQVVVSIRLRQELREQKDCSSQAFLPTPLTVLSSQLYGLLLRRCE